MQTKKLGNSDMNISRIGFGAWAIGGVWEWGWGSQEDKDSIAAIHKALDMGINWIDSAPVYGLGHSEEVIGQALKQTNHKPYVFTKCGLPWDDKKEITGNLTKASLQKELEDSLRRLDVDVIDLYQIHWPNPAEDIEQGWEALAELQQQGKIRYIGVSNFSVEQLEKIQKIAPVTSLQPPYSLAFPEVEQEILPFCEKHNIGAINYSPMASGLLSGKMTRERIENLAEDDWRRRSDHFLEPRLSRNLALVEVLKDIAGQQNCTAGEVAIAWTLLNPGITGAIVGLRREDQVEGVIKAGTISLTSEQVDAISNFIAENPIPSE